MQCAFHPGAPIVMGRCNVCGAEAVFATTEEGMREGKKLIKQRKDKAKAKEMNDKKRKDRFKKQRKRWFRKKK